MSVLNAEILAFKNTSFEKFEQDAIFQTYYVCTFSIRTSYSRLYLVL